MVTLALCLSTVLLHPLAAKAAGAATIVGGATLTGTPGVQLGHGGTTPLSRVERVLSASPTTVPVAPAAPTGGISINISGHCMNGVNGVANQAGTTSDGRPYWEILGFYFFFDSACGPVGPQWVLQDGVFDPTKMSNFMSDCNEKHGCCGWMNSAPVDANALLPPLGDHAWNQFCCNQDYSICSVKYGLVRVEILGAPALGTTIPAGPSGWEDYAGGPGSVCRHTLTDGSPEVGREEAYMVVTHLDDMLKCRSFCDTIKPCYGFEFLANDASTNYGNCEIWILPIRRFKPFSSGNFQCFNRTTTYASPQSGSETVTAGFTVANLSFTDLSLASLTANSPTMLSITVALKMICESEVNATVDVSTPTISGSNLHVRLVFASAHLHPALLHNTVRAAAMGFKLPAFNVVPSSPSALIARFETHLRSLGGRWASLTWDFTTLTSLANAQPGSLPLLWEGSLHLVGYSGLGCSGQVQYSNLQGSISGNATHRCQEFTNSGSKGYVLQVFSACSEEGQSWDQFDCADAACTQCQLQGRVEGYKTVPSWENGACATYRFRAPGSQEIATGSFTMNFQTAGSPLPASDIYKFPCNPENSTPQCKQTKITRDDVARLRALGFKPLPGDHCKK